MYTISNTKCPKKREQKKGGDMLHLLAGLKFLAPKAANGSRGGRRYGSGPIRTGKNGRDSGKGNAKTLGNKGKTTPLV